MSDGLKNICACAVASCALSALAMPKPGYYHPSSLQVGTTTRVIMGGDIVGGVQGAYVTGEGVTVKRIVPVPGFPRAAGRTQTPWVTRWFYDILEKKDTKHRELPPEALAEDTDWIECAWWFYLDELDDLELQIVSRDHFTPVSYPQDTPALNHLLILDIEVAPNAEPGRRDIMLYDGSSASAPHPFYITKEPHLVEPFFVIPPRNPPKGKHYRLPGVLHLPPDLKPQNIPVHLDGQIWPGETDSFQLKLKKGQHLVCSAVGREFFPYLGDAVPGFFNPVLRLYNPAGEEVAFADDFHFLPDPVLQYHVAADGTYRLDIHDNLFRGGPNFVYSVFCRAEPDDRIPYTPKERAFECYPQPAAFVPPEPGPGRDVRKGAIDIPGRVDRHFFEVKEPCRMHFELYARRQGSPIDAVMEIYGPMSGLPLASTPKLVTWDDNPGRLFVVKNVGSDDLPIIKTNMLYEGTIPQAECDPFGDWNFTEPGKYCVTVRDSAGLGGDYYDYTLAISPAEPTFEVFALSSAMKLNGDSASFTACILRRNGFKGPISFDSTDDYDVNGGFYDENDLETTVEISFRKNWEGVKRFDLTASGELPDGKKVTVRVTPTDPAEQAFAYSHILPAHGFYAIRAGKSVRESFKHKGPFLTGVKSPAKHSNGQSCVSCHTNKKGRGHNQGKACNTCHKGRE